MLNDLEGKEMSHIHKSPFNTKTCKHSNLCYLDNEIIMQVKPLVSIYAFCVMASLCKWHNLIQNNHLLKNIMQIAQVNPK